MSALTAGGRDVDVVGAQEPALPAHAEHVADGDEGVRPDQHPAEAKDGRVGQRCQDAG